jgi:polyphenol oxidase
MIHTQVNGVSLYRFESFNSPQLGHAFISRKGGVSPDPWLSLNQGGTVGDARENVVENRKRAFEAIDRPVESIYDVWQVHGTEVVCTDTSRSLEVDHVKADAIFTNNPEVTLFMRFADCVPILIYDPKRKVVGIIHAGWQGTVKKIVEQAIEVIKDHYHCEPADMIAGIGPSIGPCHYQVGEEVVEAVKMAFGNRARELIEYRNERPYFDLWNANKILLQENGVKFIQTAGVCTACNTDEWYSHRAEHGKTGRFAAAIFLRKGD